jgi:hypothetical protein
MGVPNYVGVVTMYGPLTVRSSPCLCNTVVYHSVYEDLHVDVRGLIIKFANSPPCACRGSSGRKPQYVLMTLAYQVYYLEVLTRLHEKVRRK